MPASQLSRMNTDSPQKIIGAVSGFLILSGVTWFRDYYLSAMRMPVVPAHYFLVAFGLIEVAIGGGLWAGLRPYLSAAIALAWFKAAFTILGFLFILVTVPDLRSSSWFYVVAAVHTLLAFVIIGFLRRPEVRQAYAAQTSDP